MSENTSEVEPRTESDDNGPIIGRYAIVVHKLRTSGGLPMAQGPQTLLYLAIEGGEGLPHWTKDIDSAHRFDTLELAMEWVDNGVIIGPGDMRTSAKEFGAEAVAAIITKRNEVDPLDEAIDAILKLFFSASDNEATAFPFWFVAQAGGSVIGRPVMISHGIWFSRERAEEHLKNKAHRYPKTAFVWCESAHDSYGGLKYLYELMLNLQKVREGQKTAAEKLVDRISQFCPEGTQIKVVGLKEPSDAK